MTLPAERDAEDGGAASDYAPASLDQATEAMRLALAAEDLDALAGALRARRAAIDTGASPTPEAFEAGEFALSALAAMKRRWAVEGARIEQVRAGIAGSLQHLRRLNFDYEG
ncbi:MAG TPA: hypothetical protein VH640_28700 [Bryobacteraceae bacterium]|jgi:hypothetical protein